MSSLPPLLSEFEKTCRDHFGSGAVGTTERSVFVAFETGLVHVNLDETSHRAVVWAELAWPDHADADDLERAAASFTSREFLAHGFVLGANEAAKLILLGRSVEQEFLFRYAGLVLLSDVAGAIPAAAEALQQSAGRPSPNQPERSDALSRAVP